MQGFLFRCQLLLHKGPQVMQKILSMIHRGKWQIDHRFVGITIEGVDWQTQGSLIGLAWPLDSKSKKPHCFGHQIHVICRSLAFKKPSSLADFMGKIPGAQTRPKFQPSSSGRNTCTQQSLFCQGTMEPWSAKCWSSHCVTVDKTMIYHHW